MWMGSTKLRWFIFISNHFQSLFHLKSSSQIKRVLKAARALSNPVVTSKRLASPLITLMYTFALKWVVGLNFEVPELKISGIISQLCRG